MKWLFAMVGLCMSALVTAAPPQVVRVGINASYPPFESVDARGRLVGFDIDLVNAVARVQGFEVKFVNTAWPALFDALQSGRVDMLASALAVTEARKQHFAFTRPYYYSAQALLIAADGKEEDPRRMAAVGVLDDSSSEHWLRQLGMPAGTVKPYEGMPPMIAALEKGRLDGVFGDQQALLSQRLAGKRIVRNTAFGKDAYAFMVKKDNAALLQSLNDGLAKLTARGVVDTIRAGYPSL